MIPEYLSAIGTAITPALANHLWQSTLVAGAAWLACRMLLKAHSPRVRFGVWLAASVKFLVPFAVIVQAGHWLGARPLLTPAQSQQVFDVIAGGSSGLVTAPFRVSPAPQASATAKTEPKKAEAAKKAEPKKAAATK